MTITRDHIANYLGISADSCFITKSEIDRANHFYELGRRKQRESDANLFELDPSCDNFQWIGEAIRNNTGDLT